jgi:GGDEF domain-containing protein
MSLQGPMIVVAENPAADLVQALGAAGAFPIVEAKWADAPTAFVAVKPSAVVIAEPGPAASEASSRMLCLQIATLAGPIVPAIAYADGDRDAAIPIALSADATLPVTRMIARLQSAMRVRALHATVLRRIELFAAQGGTMPVLPTGDALDDATVLIAGRGRLYPALSAAMGKRVKTIGALNVETAAKHIEARDIEGIVIGDGLPPRAIETFLTMLAQDPRFRDMPIAAIDGVPPEFAESLTNIDHVAADPERIVVRLVPHVRMHAFEARLKRMLKALDTDGMFEPDTGLLTRDSFWRDLGRSVAQAANSGEALSLARYSFDGALDPRANLDNARLVKKLIRNIDFACRDDDGTFLVAFTQTDLRSAHVVARRIAGAIKSANGSDAAIVANVTLATLKNGDSVDSLMQRVEGSRMVAAE